MPATASVSAVIITFNPERERFEGLINALKPQVAQIVVVDNGSQSSVLEWISTLVQANGLELITLGENRGIAAAQNVGIEHVRSLGAAYVILFDHDSIPESDMVAILLGALQSKERAGFKIAAVGPRYFDVRQNNAPPFIEVKGCRVIRHACEESRQIMPVSYLIASGSLIPMATLDAVGSMREDLFIDYVDIEWGLRAAHHGYQSFGVCHALMAHDLGDPPIVFLGKGRPLHSPLRHYYLFRNAVLLYREQSFPLQWKIGDSWRLFLKYVFYILYAKPRMLHFKMMTKGLWHGIIGQTGMLR